MASALAPDEAACGRYRDADSVLCLHDPVLSFSGNFYRSVPWANNSFIDWDFTTVDWSSQDFPITAQEALSSSLLFLSLNATLIAPLRRRLEKERSIIHPLIVWRSEHTPRQLVRLWPQRR